MRWWTATQSVFPVKISHYSSAAALQARSQRFAKEGVLRWFEICRLVGKLRGRGVRAPPPTFGVNMHFGPLDAKWCNLQVKIAVKNDFFPLNFTCDFFFGQGGRGGGLNRAVPVLRKLITVKAREQITIATVPHALWEQKLQAQHSTCQCYIGSRMMTD